MGVYGGQPTAEAIAQLMCSRPADGLPTLAFASLSPPTKAAVAAASKRVPAGNDGAQGGYVQMDLDGATAGAAAGTTVTVPTTPDTAATLVPTQKASTASRELVERGRFVDTRYVGSLRRPSRGGDGPPTEGWPLKWLPPRNLKFNDSVAAAEDEALAAGRKAAVRGVMKRAWDAYRKYAFGADELKPVSNRSHEWLHLGATLVDVLDNLWLMDMKAEFAEAREWVATRLHFNRASGISMFETVIRIFGGLLSAFELSKDRLFLNKAQELADKMMYTFKQHPTGLPCTTISLTGSESCTFASWTTVRPHGGRPTRPPHGAAPRDRSMRSPCGSRPHETARRHRPMRPPHETAP